DATCPLVSKVHREAEHHFAQGRRIILIGHAGHPEVIGTMGQLPAGAVLLVETVEDATRIAPDAADELAYITQTTLSIEDTHAIVAVLKSRFPRLHGPKHEDICYATTNRQQAVKAIARRCDRLLVVGAPNSSNSVSLHPLSPSTAWSYMPHISDSVALGCYYIISLCALRIKACILIFFF